MGTFAKLLSAWALSFVIYAFLIVIYGRLIGSSDSGFRAALLGIGLLMGIPAFIFAVAIGLPIMSAMKGLTPMWLIPLTAGVALAAIMRLLTAVMLPDDWQGAALALTGYAMIFGFTWGTLTLMTARST